MMNFNLEKDFKSLCNLLATYQNIWSPEVMNSYPQSLEAYPSEWLTDITNLSEDNQWRIDAGFSYNEIREPKLKNLLNNLKELSTFQKLETSEVLFSDTDFFKMKEKKRHEIKNISGFLFQKTNLAKSCIDVGGGIGHLSRTLANKHEMSSLIIESNKEFCEIGQKVNKKLNIGKINYMSEPFNKNSTYHCDSNTFALGLHACGDLSSEIIEYSVNNDLQNILSFGCCYFKTKLENHCFISSYGSKVDFNLSKYSLTLASRAHTGLTKKAFLKKKKVKSYRYALHLFLFHHLKQTEFKEVGESKFSLYEKDFSDYAADKLNYLGTEKIEKQTLDDFFESKQTRKLIEAMFCANIIRWQFGRAIEKLILIDRALYLKENNYHIELGELFDENISPRNVGIFAKKLP